MVKGATETCSFSAASYVAYVTTHFQTRLATNQVVASCENTDSWLVKIMPESRHTWDYRHLMQNKALGNSDDGIQWPDLLQDTFDLWVVKCATMLFNSWINSFCSHVSKQVARFCCLFYLTGLTPLLTWSWDKAFFRYAGNLEFQFRLKTFWLLFFYLSECRMDMVPVIILQWLVKYR